MIERRLRTNGGGSFRPSSSMLLAMPSVVKDFGIPVRFGGWEAEEEEVREEEEVSEGTGSERAMEEELKIIFRVLLFLSFNDQETC